MFCEFELMLLVDTVNLERLRSSLPSPLRCARDKEGNYRLLWAVPSYSGTAFEDGLKNAIENSISLLKTIHIVNEFNPTLWCLVHSGKEFFGLALDTILMKEMTEHGLSLVISVYTDNLPIQE